MGLDMYLTKRVYIGGNYEHRKVSGTIDLEAAGRRIVLDPIKVSEIVLSAGYWRKANAIHGWFVREVQDGVDNCRETYVTRDQLRDLKAVCEATLATKDTTLLPPLEGFFFGSTDIDEGYWQDLKETVDIISKLDLDDETETDAYFYQSSW